MKPYLMVLGAFVFIASFLLVPDVYAQFGGGGAGSGAGGAGRGGEHRKGCDCGERSAPGKGAAGSQPEPMGHEQLVYQLNTLQIDLRLTPEQTTLWRPFTERVLALESDLARQRLRGTSASARTGPTGTGVQQIARAVDDTRNRLAALEDIEAGSRALYQTLEDNQKVLADLRMGLVLGALLKG